MPDDEQALLWLWSDDFYERSEQWAPSKIPYGNPIIEAVTEELYEQVWCAAEEDISPDDKLERSKVFDVALVHGFAAGGRG